MYLILSGVFFMAYCANVFSGSFRGAPIFSDTVEMIFLFITTIFFVIEILRRAAKREADDSQSNT